MKKTGIKIPEGYVIDSQEGDVIFIRNQKGDMYQILDIDDEKPILKVKSGNIGYKIIEKVGKYTIKYNLNGIYGFSIHKGSVCLEDRFWRLADVRNAVKTM